jgi:hypothetical protein
MESQKNFRRNVQSGINIGVDMESMIHKKEDNLISTWAGGTTTQISIYPEKSEYEKRDFIWRISSANIEQEQTKFTDLPDFDRILMVLEGEVVLSHEAERISRLSQFQQDRFGGEGSTNSFGKIKDFNVMYRKGADAYLEIIDLKEGITNLTEENHLSDKYSYESSFFYCIGEFSIIVVNGTEYFLKMGDTLEINGEMQQQLEIGVMGTGKIIHGIIRFDQAKVEVIMDIPRERASLDDLKISAYLCLTNFRGSQYIFKGRKNSWHDKELQKAIARIENIMLTFIIGLAGVVSVFIWAEKFLDASAILPAVILWLVLDLFILNPLIYLIALPKPIRAHIKKIDDLSENEMKMYEQEKNSNKRTEKILKKYKITGRNKYTD